MEGSRLALGSRRFVRRGGSLGGRRSGRLRVALDLLLPRHGRKFRHRSGWWGRRFRHLQLRIRSSGRRRRQVVAPACDAGLQTMMLGLLLVPGLHIEERQVRVHQWLLRAESFCLVPFFNRLREVTFPVVSHAHGQLCLIVLWLLFEQPPQALNRPIIVALAEGEHGVVVLFLVGRHARRGGSKALVTYRMRPFLPASA
jgi:hypothetical protein